jgi:hypothetical protein
MKADWVNVLSVDTIDNANGTITVDFNL